MFPENRYVRERNERRIYQEEKSMKKDEVVIEESPQVERPPIAALPKVEQRSPDTLRPLPGGGSRRLQYQGLLSAKQLDQVEKNYPVYKAAEDKTGVNWKIIAALHYRESSLGLDPNAKGNEFQFDGANRKFATGDFQKDAIHAGKIIQEKLRKAGLEALSEGGFAGEKVQEALFRYNGTLYKEAEKSPYVMNQFDETHENMRIFRGKNVLPAWGVDRRLGAYTVIRELTRAFIA